MQASFFGHKLEQFTEYIKLEQQPDVCQLPVLKMCIKEAARKTRDEMLFNNLEDPAAWKTITFTIVRVLWSNDVRLARKIIYASELANELLEIRLNKVCCKDYVLLEKHFSDTFLEHWNRKVGRLRTKVAQAASPNHRKQLKSKLQGARRMQSLYWKSAARLEHMPAYLRIC